MTHDINTAQEILDRQVTDGAVYYFDFVEHRLQDALKKVEAAKKVFLSTQDYHAIQKLVIDLSQLNLGFDKAVVLTNKISSIHEEIEILEDLADEHNSML